jgi:ABC-type uncharacterized transport system involved in gliding motility auxiliary subunit
MAEIPRAGSNPETPAVPRAPRPGASGGRAFLAAALFVCLAAMLHYLAARHFVRKDVSRIAYYDLSEKTLQVLETVSSPVEVILLFQSGQMGYEYIENLLKEYEYRCPALRMRRVDPDRDPAVTRQILEKYPVTEANVIILTSGGGHRVLRRDELFDFDLSRTTDGGRPVIARFRGEQMITSALHGILQGRRPVAYFLSGHGERSPESFESRTGYAEIARRIAQENVEIRPLQLGEARAVPDDCSLLVIAGPRRAFAQPELDLVSDYLATRGGRLLALLDSRTQCGLEPLLENWGVKVGTGIAVDPTRSVTGRELFLRTYGNHPITLPMAGLTCVMSLPRPVEVLAPETPVRREPGSSPSDLPVAVSLALTSPSGWVEMNGTEWPPRFSPEESDRPGPVSIAVAVEKGGRSLNEIKVRPTRMVILGDSAFLANENIAGGNADFLLNAVHWMLDRPELLAIPSRNNKDFQLSLTAAQVRSIGWTVLLGLPALALAIGWIVALRRRT